MISDLQLWGAGTFGAIIGWYVYYINRHRRDDVSASDLVTLLGILGGTAVLKLFPSQSELFGAYGIGLGVGFFGYFLVMIFLVIKSDNFDADYFLDGRRKKLPPQQYIPTRQEQANLQGAPMDGQRPPSGNPGA